MLDGSNAITSVELRMSESNDADALAHCEDIPASAEPGSTSTATLDEVAFQRLRAGDAAMNHFLQVEGNRALQAGRCAAIDLLVHGTPPEVHDPLQPAPDTQAQVQVQVQAWSALHAALAGVRLAY